VKYRASSDEDAVIMDESEPEHTPWPETPGEDEGHDATEPDGEPADVASTSVTPNTPTTNAMLMARSIGFSSMTFPRIPLCIHHFRRIIITVLGDWSATFTDRAGDIVGVARNRSLDEFASVGQDSPEGAGASAVESIESTTVWSPEGGACARCDAVVKRRWRAEEGLVCVECKSW
jgi:hypothetical protein